MSTKNAWKLFVFFGVVIYFFWGIQCPKRSSRMQLGQFESANTVRGLGEMLVEYQSQHKGKAQKWTDVLSSTSEMTPALLMCRYFDQNWKPANWMKNPADIDIFSDYILAPSNSKGILVFERPYLWSDNSVAVCFTNLVEHSVYTSSDSATNNTWTQKTLKQLDVRRLKREDFLKLFRINLERN